MLDASLLPLENQNVRLRAIESDDAIAFAEGAADPVVRKYGHLPESEYTPTSVKKMIVREAVPGLTRGDLGVLAIADSFTDAFAGSLVIFNITELLGEVGFWIHPAYRGSGLSIAALNLAVRFARESGLQELTARTVPENSASQRALARAGFIFRSRGVGVAPSGNTSEFLSYYKSVD